MADILPVGLAIATYALRFPMGQAEEADYVKTVAHEFKVTEDFVYELNRFTSNPKFTSLNKVLIEVRRHNRKSL